MSLRAVMWGSGGGGGAGMSGMDSLALPMAASMRARPAIAIHFLFQHPFIISPRGLLRVLQWHRSKRLDQCPLVRVEQSNHSIKAAGANLFAIGGECDGEDGAFVTGQRGDAFAVFGID